MASIETNLELAVKPVESDEELRLANDLMAKIHSQDYFHALHWLETSGAGYPGYRREHTRIALWKGEIAGALRMNTETIQLGEARLKMGGFGWVTTSPRHRQKGIGRALMLDTLEYMRRNNYHVSMLFGIPNFYHRFGFATTLANYAIIMDTAEARGSTASTLRLRDAKPGDIPTLQRIHAANDAGAACSLLRNCAHFSNKWELCKTIRVLTNNQGKVLAYLNARRDGDALRIDEIGVADLSVSADALSVCAALAAEEALGKIRFQVPPSHPFARYVLQYQSIHEMRVERNAGGMMAFVNLGEALESLIPEWESLLPATALRDNRTEVTLVIDRDYYRLRVNRGIIDIAPFAGANKISLTSAELMHLVTGYRYLEDILASRRCILTADARLLLNTIFPKRHPYVWVFDRF